MPHPLTIRDATPADAAAIAEIYNASIRAGDATLDDRIRSAADIRRQMDGFGERETYLVLDGDGEVLGWGIIKRYSDRAGYRYCCETSVYLRRDQRRRGYGSRLQHALMERCTTYGYHHLLAKILARNTASLMFHERFGYEVVGTQREIGYKDERWHDVVILQCILPGGGPE